MLTCQRITLVVFVLLASAGHALAQSSGDVFHGSFGQWRVDIYSGNGPDGSHWQLVASDGVGNTRTQWLDHRTSSLQSVVVWNKLKVIVIDKSTIWHVSVVSLTTSDVDFFVCLWPSVSSTGRYIAYVMSDGTDSDAYLVSDASLSATANRMTPSDPSDSSAA